MAKILHFGILKSMNPGVKSQLDSENVSSRRLHLDHEIVYFCNDTPDRKYMKTPSSNYKYLKRIVSDKFFNYVNLRLSAYTWLKRNQRQYDIILIRYPLGDIIFSLFSLFIKPFYTIHHTKEVMELKSRHNFISKIQLLLERLQIKILKTSIKGFIGVTSEIACYENQRSKSNKPTFTYPNGISVQNSEIPDDRKGKFKFLFLCNQISPWHGIEKIYIELRKSSRDDFELYLIGNISIPSDIANDTRVKQLGYIQPIHLPQILSKIDLSLGPFNLMEISLSEACPLKTRDSLRNGIPVLADYKDTSFDDAFPFFIKSEFKIETCLFWAKKYRKFSKNEIAKSANDKISKEKIVCKLFSQIERIEEKMSKNNQLI